MVNHDGDRPDLAESRKQVKARLLLLAATSAMLLAIGVALHLSLAGAAQTSQATAGTWTFQGRVYEGDVGNESQALPGVTVFLYGGNNPYPAPGVFITSTTTDLTGWYGLQATDGYEYYHIREADPAGYTSIGATTVSGTVRTSNWIEYSLPDGKTLTGNKFWDKPWITLFEDDFNDGIADGWELEEGWSVAPNGDGGYLSGSGHHWAMPVVEGWSDYQLTAKVKVISGTVHLNFRLTQEMPMETDWIQRRYFLGLFENRLYLKKQIGTDFFDLYAEDIPFSLGSWHTVQIHVEETSIQAYVDGQMRANITDTEDTLLFGRFAFETLDASQADFDDVLVTGPLPSESPPGYVWKRMGGPSGGLGYDVRIRPLNKDIMFVTDNPSGVNKSYDAGNTWVQSNEGITSRFGSSMDDIPVFSLTVDPGNPNIIWAGTQYTKGIYRSEDGGENWEKRDSGVTEGNEISFRGFGIHPADSDIVFAGAEISTGTMGKEFDQTRGKIYKTTNGGMTWRSVWSGDNLVRFVLFDYTNPITMYASTGIFDREAANDQPDQGVGEGILKSTDGGETWLPINNGIPAVEGNRFLGFLEMHPITPTILFAASGNNAWGDGGIFRTTDGGDNWTNVLGGDIFTVVTLSTSNPEVVYAGSSAAVYRSDDGGDNWQKFWKGPVEHSWGPPGVRAGFPIGAVVDPDDPMTIFINNYQGGNFKSIDGGQTWVDASQGYTGAKLHDISINAEWPADVYTIGRSGPFRSSDGGTDWAGLAYYPANCPEWYAVAVNPGNPQELLISDEYGGVLFKSTDRGTSWTTVFDLDHSGCTGGPQWCRDGFRTIAYAPSDPSIVYAGMSASRRTIDGAPWPARPSYGMYKSTDAGDSWVEINTGLPTSLLNILAIAIDPTDADVVFVGTWKDGVYKTTNGGEGWVLKSNGLGSADVRSLAIDPYNPQILYAGLSEGGGIFKSIDGGEQWGAVNDGLSIACPSYLLPIGGGAQGVSLETPPDILLNSTYSSVAWTSIRHIIIDPTDTQTIYAADYHAGVYLSTNGGASWSPINENLTMKAVTALDISSDGHVVYAATWGGGVFRLGDVDIYPAYVPAVMKDYGP